MTVTGRKNYKGKVTAVFSILPADLGSASGITAEPLYVKASGKQVFGKPVIRYNGKIVPASEYTLTYEGKDNMNNFAKPGEYNITVTGKGNNFTGKLTVKQYNLEKLPWFLKRIVLSVPIRETGLFCWVIPIRYMHRIKNKAWCRRL